MVTGQFIPRGAASFRIDYDGPSQEFYFLLQPQLTMLAFSAALEPLRIANQVTNRELYRWFTMTEDGGPIRCSNNVQIVPDMVMGDVPRQALAFACSGNDPTQIQTQKVSNWIGRQRAHGTTMGGICTGAFALATVGLLRGRRFTLHWENQPAFAEIYPDLHPSPNLFEIDGPVLTCGGGNASTDMMLRLIEREHGKELAIIVADMCIHGRSGPAKVPQKSAYAVALGSRNPHLVGALQYMSEHLEEPLDIAELADRLDISRRQLERLFKRYVGVTPNQAYFDLRLARAHALLNQTDMTVTEIAVATGFSSRSQLGVRFRQKFGTSPQAFRKGWSETE